MFPLDNASTGLIGIISKSTSANGLDSATFVSAIWILDISSPIPGFIIFPIPIAIEIASAVVTI